jgi:aminopeptidase N
MLRETVGDTAFWKGINTYLTRHKFTAVESSDLKRSIEEASGQDLDWFFSQWVYGTGYPKLEIEQTYDTASQAFKITVSQTQKGDSSTPAAFTLPLEIDFTTEDGARREKIVVTKKQETFSFRVPKMPSAIKVDDGSKIPLMTVKLRPLTIIQ